MSFFSFFFSLYFLFKNFIHLFNFLFRELINNKYLNKIFIFPSEYFPKLLLEINKLILVKKLVIINSLLFSSKLFLLFNNS